VRPATSLPAKLIDTLYREAHAEQWQVPVERFAEALRTSAERAAPADVARYVRALHLEDLALACACAAGEERAWDHFIREHRPALYRAADALDPSGNAREIADSIYGELYGLSRASERTGEAGTERRSLFRYYHGRSSLKTWLRAVLAQRHVDGLRAARRIDPLPEEDVLEVPSTIAPPPPDPDRVRFRALILGAFKRSVAALTDRDRLRLACYYSRGLTLAETGRVLKEHEATVSRHLAKSRQVLRHEIERYLRDDDGLDAAQIEQCFAHIVEDPGPMDLDGMLRKNSASDRSI